MLGASARRRRARRPRRIVVVVVVAILVAAVAAGTWAWFRYGQGESRPDPVGSGVVDSVEAPGREGAPPGTAGRDSVDLPSLDASDALIRDLVAGLSARPEWASWLVSDDLVRRFVLAVVAVANESSPAPDLQYLAPEEEFAVREVDGRTFMDPAGYERYDLLAATFASLDTRSTVRLHHRLHPLFEEAHRELGFPAGTFDETLARAVRNLLAVEVPEGSVEVVPDEGVYAFRDPSLEERSSAAKQLIRMGPDNARRIQGKLRELADALEIPVR